jgi:hypothetical protein
MRERSLDKNESELVFEEYLRNHDLSDFVYEAPIPGTQSKPDYRVSFGGTHVYFDVKEFEPDPSDFNPGFGAIDPYGPIRWKIHDVWKQFQGCEGHPCGLVLFNSKKPLVYLWSEIVSAAMFGDLGMQIPFNPNQVLLDAEAREMFTKGGMMISYEEGRATGARNLNTSAVIALERLEVGDRRFKVEIRRIKKEGKNLSRTECFEIFEKAQGTEKDYALQELRVVVCENPGARTPLPKEMFHGPYDERYGPANGYITRLFVGEGIRELEDLEAQHPDHLEESLRNDVEGSSRREKATSD